MMPVCDHTGTPRHFHSSTTSGAACLMRRRMRASISPRQSPSSLILASINADGEPPLLFFAVAVAFFMVMPKKWVSAISAIIATRFSRRGQRRIDHPAIGGTAGLVAIGEIRLDVAEIVQPLQHRLGLVGGGAHAERAAADVLPRHRG